MGKDNLLSKKINAIILLANINYQKLNIVSQSKKLFGLKKSISYER
jgi:hypothetical protein